MFLVVAYELFMSMWTWVFESKWVSYTSDKFNLNNITAHGVWRSLKIVQIDFQAYANQLLANENEARLNNQRRRFKMILKFK